MGDTIDGPSANDPTGSRDADGHLPVWSVAVEVVCDRPDEALAEFATAQEAYVVSDGTQFLDIHVSGHDDTDAHERAERLVRAILHAVDNGVHRVAFADATYPVA